jgi:hypothetical protein
MATTTYRSIDITWDGRHWPFVVCGQRFRYFTTAQAYIDLQIRMAKQLGIVNHFSG